MSLSDCTECWETPCACGEHWKDYTMDKLVEQIVSMVAKKDRQDGIIILTEALRVKYDEIIDKALEQIKNKD